ncbi:MAG: hypothetical protein KJZ84_22845 [Bryobacteraceae bacterium]|nr:hypothetical protein [Bryobacteraceae bacterium]
MARGWESKDIAAQQDLAAQRAALRVPTRSENDRRRDLLELQRTRLLGELQRACAPRMRGLIEAELAAVNQKIAESA